MMGIIVNFIPIAECISSPQPFPAYEGTAWVLIHTHSYSVVILKPKKKKIYLLCCHLIFLQHRKIKLKYGEDRLFGVYIYCRTTKTQQVIGGNQVATHKRKNLFVLNFLIIQARIFTSQRKLMIKIPFTAGIELHLTET